MKRISKSISTQIACRPRHDVASGESSQVKSGRRRSRLAQLASRALLAVHLHSAPPCLQCIYTLLAVLLCSASMLAAHLCLTLLNLPRELCLQCISTLLAVHHSSLLAVHLCPTLLNLPWLWCVSACTASILVVITSQPFLQISLLHHHQQSFLSGWFSLLLPQCFCIAHIVDSIVFAHGTSQTIHWAHCMNAHIANTEDCLTWLQTTQMAANAVFAIHTVHYNVLHPLYNVAHLILCSITINT